MRRERGGGVVWLGWGGCVRGALCCRAHLRAPTLRSPVGYLAFGVDICGNVLQCYLLPNPEQTKAVPTAVVNTVRAAK